MAVRLRPSEFIAEPTAPFASDRLDRRPRVEALCRRIRRIPGPAVLAVRAGFGGGKTAFLRMCSAHLRSQETAVVEFNAWLQGHTDDPLRDLMSALSSELGQPEPLKDLLGKILARGLSKVSYGLIEPEDLERQSPELIQEWEDRNELRNSLQQTLAATVQDHNGKLVVLVDELDRCLPKYALGTLNAARNLLDVPGIVVVLGLNPREIEARVRQLYGTGTDAEIFLERFVDYSIDLRRPDAESGGINQFLNGVSAAAQTDSWLRVSANEYPDEMIKLMADRLDLSLRDIEQLVHGAALALDQPEAAELDTMRLQAFLSILALRIGAPSAYHELLLDPDSVYVAARALRNALSVTPRDVIGLQMIAVLILTCIGPRHGLTAEALGDEMSTEPPILDTPFTEALLECIQSVARSLMGRHLSLREIADLLELAS